MPTLSEIQAKLPQLLNRVRAAETRLANPPAKANKNTAAGALATELGGAVSDALFGTPEIGRLVLREAATEQAHERRRRFDDDGRQEGSRILAAAESLLVGEIPDVGGRALTRWRRELAGLRTSPTTRLVNLLRHVTRILNEISTTKARKAAKKPRDRNNFTAHVVGSLQRRVGHRCSNPDCLQPTAGPSRESPVASTNVGEAAHITAAAKGGRRYDPGLQPSERSSIHNGIWLCAKCARMIDRDEVRYSVAVLHEWKQLAEDRATADIEGQARARPRRVGIPVAYDEQLATNLTPADAAELEALASEFANSTERALTETTRQRAARVSLQAVVEYLKRRGRTAHLEQLPEGSCNCPRALSGLALPLLVLHVDHVVVVLDDAANGLYCYVMDSTALDRDPLPLQEGWLRIDPACAYRAIVPLIEQRVRDSMLVVP